MLVLLLLLRNGAWHLQLLLQGTCRALLLLLHLFAAAIAALEQDQQLIAPCNSLKRVSFAAVLPFCVSGSRCWGIHTQLTHDHQDTEACWLLATRLFPFSLKQQDQQLSARSNRLKRVSVAAVLQFCVSGSRCWGIRTQLTHNHQDTEARWLLATRLFPFSLKQQDQLPDCQMEYGEEIEDVLNAETQITAETPEDVNILVGDAIDFIATCDQPSELNQEYTREHNTTMNNVNCHGCGSFQKRH